MKKIAKLITLNTIVMTLTGAIFAFSQAYAAGTATLSLTPASGTYVVGNTVSVNIYEDSGSDNVNAVQANFTYPSSLLSFVGITDSSAFSVDAQNSVSGGTAKIARGTFTAVSGSQLVATVKFTATASGTANLDFSAGSSVVRSSDNGSESLTTYNAAYTINNPATPNTGGTSTPPTTTKTTNKTTPSTPASTPSTPSTPAPDTTPPTITAITPTNLSTRTATITWETSEPATTEIDLGFTTQYIVNQVDTTLTKTHKVVIDPKYLTPGATYHFIVKSTDQSGNLAVSKDMTFKTTAAVVAAPPKKSTNFWPVLAAIVVIGGLAVGSAMYIRRMKGQAGSKPPTPTTPANNNHQSQAAVITPGASVSHQVEPTPNKVDQKPPTGGSTTPTS